MKEMNVKTLDELQDKVLGKIGTPDRDAFEAELNQEIHDYFVGEAIRKARLAKNLTQQQLGEKIGVQKAQISRLERGKSITLATLTKVFRALDLTVKLQISGIGELDLC